MNAVAQAAALERKAREALVLATAARVAAERVERTVKREAQNRWINAQMRAAAPDPGTAAPEMIVIRQAYGLSGGKIEWDVICDTQPGRTRRNEPSRRNADRYATQLRALGHAVRVLQSGDGRG